ncbi:hypothetical protein D3C85_1599880 [compost metagenome]
MFFMIIFFIVPGLSPVRFPKRIKIALPVFTAFIFETSMFSIKAPSTDSIAMAERNVS